MRAALHIYLKALALYAALTIPALAEPTMYFFSILFALTYGWLAFLVFAIAYMLLSGVRPWLRVTILFITVVLGVSTALNVIGVSLFNGGLLHMGELLAFPIAAIISGWISLLMSKKLLIAGTSNNN